MKSVGMIGLGLLGSAMRDRLLAGGWSVTGFDVDSSRPGVDTASAADLAGRCGVVVLSLPDSRIAAGVIAEIGPAMMTTAGGLVIDTTTGDPADSERAAAALVVRGVEFVDATVGGSSAQARAGEALIMAGGSEAAFARARPLLEALAGSVFHVGAAGAGARMKLVFNLVLGLNRAVLAEGLAFARAYGLEAGAALEVLRRGAAYSAVMDTKGPMMIEGGFDPPRARLAQHLKDVRLILEEGGRLGARLPLSAVHAELLGGLVSAGWGGADNAAVIRAFDPEK